MLGFLILGAAIASAPVAHAQPASEEAITRTALRYVLHKTKVSDPMVTVEKIEGRFARAKVRSVSRMTDPATVYLKKRWTGQWTVLLLGTDITAADLAKRGIPPSLMN